MAESDVACGAFWSWTTGLYHTEDVKRLSLMLQDTYEVTVMEWFFYAWLGRLGLSVDGAILDALHPRVVEWDGSMIEPIRTQRRAWRASATTPSLCASALQLELAAEQLLATLLVSGYLDFLATQCDSDSKRILMHGCGLLDAEVTGGALDGRQDVDAFFPAETGPQVRANLSCASTALGWAVPPAVVTAFISACAASGGAP